MKKAIIIGTAVMMTGGAFLVTQLFWNDQVDQASEEAMEKVTDDHDGSTTPGSSITRFMEEAAEKVPGSDTAEAAEKDEKDSSPDAVKGDSDAPVKGEVISDDNQSEAGSEGEKVKGSSESDKSSDRPGERGQSGEKESSAGRGGPPEHSQAGGASGERGSERSSSGRENAASPGQGSGGGPGKPLQAQEILDTYLIQFKDLQTQEIERVDTITEEARTEYKKYEAGETDESAEDLQARYVQRVHRLEDQADARFDDIYEELRAALEENGHDPDKAGEFKAVYNAEKETRRLEAVNRIFDH